MTERMRLSALIKKHLKAAGISFDQLTRKVQKECWGSGEFKIKVLAHGVRYAGAGDMLGGRVRCHFECPEDAAIGTNGFIQVQLDYAVDAAKMHRFQVEIVEKPNPAPRRPKPKPDNKEPDEKGDAKKTIMPRVPRANVSTRKRDPCLEEIPDTRVGTPSN
jgi:hypothetical protein